MEKIIQKICTKKLIPDNTNQFNFGKQSEIQPVHSKDSWKEIFCKIMENPKKKKN